MSWCAKELLNEGVVLLHRLGKGHFAEAWLIRDEKVAKLVDLEVLSPEDRHLALQEAEVLSRLQHVNIVRLERSFLLSSETCLCLLIQYCPGGDLQELIKTKSAENDPKFPSETIRNWLQQLGSALSYVHEKKILHRDVKSSNVFLLNKYEEKTPDCLLGDFGISRVLEQTENAKTCVGTPYYLSPELCKSESYSFSSDIWAFGCTAFEIICLKRPFRSNSLAGLVYRICGQKQVWPRTSDLQNLVDWMLEKERQNRPSAKEVLRYLETPRKPKNFSLLNQALSSRQI